MICVTLDWCQVLQMTLSPHHRLSFVDDDEADSWSKNGNYIDVEDVVEQEELCVVHASPRGE